MFSNVDLIFNNSFTACFSLLSLYSYPLLATSVPQISLYSTPSCCLICFASPSRHQFIGPYGSTLTFTCPHINIKVFKTHTFAMSCFVHIGRDTRTVH